MTLRPWEKIFFIFIFLNPGRNSPFIPVLRGLKISVTIYIYIYIYIYMSDKQNIIITPDISHTSQIIFTKIYLD